MKRIYAFTLDSEDYPSSKFRYNLRLIAYLLYDKIYNYDGEYSTSLVINKNIKYNNIYECNSSNTYEGNYNGEYYLQYDEYDEKYINYEPFLIGNRSFALTIDDEIMSEEVIRKLMDEVLFEILLVTRVEYSYTIKTMVYVSKNKDDERYRKKAVRQLHDTLEDTVGKKKELVRKRVMNKPLLKKNISIF